MTARFQKLRSANESGFTLIELLIVIVILGILAGIAIFAVSAFKTDASNACTKANTRISAAVSAANSVGSGGTYTSSGGSC